MEKAKASRYFVITRCASAGGHQIEPQIIKNNTRLFIDLE